MLQFGIHQSLPASCVLLIFPAAGAAGNEPNLPPLTRPALPVWRMRLREAGQKTARGWKHLCWLS